MGIICANFLNWSFPFRSAFSRSMPMTAMNALPTLPLTNALSQSSSISATSVGSHGAVLSQAQKTYFMDAQRQYAHIQHRASPQPSPGPQRRFVHSQMAQNEQHPQSAGVGVGHRHYASTDMVSGQNGQNGQRRKKSRKRRKQMQLANSSENRKKPMVTGYLQRRHGDDSSSSLLSIQSAPHSSSLSATTASTATKQATDDGASSILGSLTSVTSMAYGYLMGSATDTPGRYG